MTSQTTILNSVQCSGVGVHHGIEAKIQFKPAPNDFGIQFKRVDIKDKVNLIPARFDQVVDTRLCTCIGNKDGVCVSTIEHLMAAIHALGIDNLLIEIDQVEVPILDGSSNIYLNLLETAKIKTLEQKRSYLKIINPVVYKNKEKEVSLIPTEENRLDIEFVIQFDNAIIGKESLSFTLNREYFKNEIAYARTFGFYKDVQQLRNMGLGKGANLDNVIVIDEDKILNKDGLRAKDEFVRHKIIDAIGDLYTAGMPICGKFIGKYSGHADTNALLKTLFGNPKNYTIIK